MAIKTTYKLQSSRMVITMGKRQDTKSKQIIFILKILCNRNFRVNRVFNCGRTELEDSAKYPRDAFYDKDRKAIRAFAPKYQQRKIG